MYYTVIKHNRYLRTRGKCRKHELQAKNNKSCFFYVLYSDKTWVFDQSERVQGPIYIIKLFKAQKSQREPIVSVNFLVKQRTACTCIIDVWGYTEI